MLVVAACNDATSCMLIRAAGATGKPTYEALAEWAGGKGWKVSASSRQLSMQAAAHAACSMSTMVVVVVAQDSKV